MLRALRVVSVERGHDPRDFALVAFGGAGPAARLRARRGARDRDGARARPPPACSRRSASSASEERRDRVRSYVRPLAEAGELPARGRGRPALPRPVVRADRAARRPSCAARFHRAHEERYGYADRDGRSSSSPSAPPTSRPGPSSTCRAQTRCTVDGPGGPRARRRDLLGSPRVGGVRMDAQRHAR